jgi:hypothetical protein
MSLENACLDFSKALEFGVEGAKEKIDTYCYQKF